MIKKGEREGEGTTKSKTSQMQINDSDMGTAASTRLTEPDDIDSAQGSISLPSLDIKKRFVVALLLLLLSKRIVA